ncbi:MAG: hypothetical protein ACLP6E_16710 [Acidimicrobiales bacterium]
MSVRKATSGKSDQAFFLRGLPRSVTAAAAVAVLAVGLAACSSTGQGSAGHSSNAPGTTRSTPAEAVLLAAKRGISDRTARVSMTMSANGPMGSSSGSMSLVASGNGVVDFANQSAQIDMSMSILSEKINLTVVAVGGNAYEKLSGIPGVSGMLEPGKSWIELPVGTSLGSSAALDPMSNPADFLVALTRKGVTVTPVGSSRVDGVEATEYDVKYPENLASLGTGLGSLPSSVQQMLHGLTMHVWVDSSGLLRRMSMSIPVPELGTMTLTMDMSDYGAPVNVSAPPSSEVENFQSIARQLGNLSSVSSGSL